MKALHDVKEFGFPLNRCKKVTSYLDLHRYLQEVLNQNDLFHNAKPVTELLVLYLQQI